MNHQKERSATKENFLEIERGFQQLLEKEKEHPVSVRTFLSLLSGRGKLLFLIFFVLPFSQFPGIAIFIGLLICYVGIRICFDKRSIWLPNFILKKTIPSYFLKKAVGQILFGLRILKKWSFPRFMWTTRQPFTHHLNGIMIAMVGLAISLAPPIPLIGMVAFVAILCIGIGALNQDEVYIITGYVFSVIYFALMVIALKIFSIAGIINFFRDLFHI